MTQVKTTVLHPGKLTDKDFDAFWEACVEAAAQEAIRTGDESQVEAIMLAHGEAYAARYPTN